MFKKITKKPNHIGIILDGNRRWAKKRGFSTYQGHKEGGAAVVRLIEALLEYGIKYASIFAFSTENWKRSKEELSSIFKLAKEFSKKEELSSNSRVKFNFFGDLSAFDKDFQNDLENLKEKTKNNTDLTLNVCLNYGGRADIVQAVNKLIKNGAKSVTEEDISKNLYSSDLPDLDIVIRTSGEKRISNFMIYQLAYAEFYFTKQLWPEFNKKSLKKALIDYSKRHRRYGGN